MWKASEKTLHVDGVWRIEVSSEIQGNVNYCVSMDAVKDILEQRNSRDAWITVGQQCECEGLTKTGLPCVHLRVAAKAIEFDLPPPVWWQKGTVDDLFNNEPPRFTALISSQTLFSESTEVLVQNSSNFRPSSGRPKKNYTSRATALSDNDDETINESPLGRPPNDRRIDSRGIRTPAARRSIGYRKRQLCSICKRFGHRAENCRGEEVQPKRKSAKQLAEDEQNELRHQEKVLSEQTTRESRRPAKVVKQTHSTVLTAGMSALGAALTATEYAVGAFVPKCREIMVALDDLRILVCPDTQDAVAESEMSGSDVIRNSALQQRVASDIINILKGKPLCAIYIYIHI